MGCQIIGSLKAMVKDSNQLVRFTSVRSTTGATLILLRRETKRGVVHVVPLGRQTPIELEARGATFLITRHDFVTEK